MRRLVLPFVAIVAVSFAVALGTAGGDASRPADAEHRPVVHVGPDPSVGLARAQAVVEYVTVLGRQQVGSYIAALQHDELAAFLASLPAPVLPSATAQSGAQPVAHTSGPHSDAWWAAIAQCESGTTNGWRTGYFGLEGRPGISSLSYAQQLDVARSIDSWAGDSAWGCAPVAWANVPSG